MKQSLEYGITVPNDDREELEIECRLTDAGEERYTLRYPAGHDGDTKWPSESIHLTGAEIDEVWNIVQKFRQMKQSATQTA